MNRLRSTLTAVSIAAAVVLPATPAAAGHGLKMVHTPPPSAVEGQDLQLTVVTGSDCRGKCPTTTVRLQYRDPSGRIESLDRRVTLHAGSVNFTVPRAHLRGRHFNYTLTATQESCLGHCHSTSVRSPVKGEHGVRISQTPPQMGKVDQADDDLSPSDWIGPAKPRPSTPDVAAVTSKLGGLVDRSGHPAPVTQRTIEFVKGGSPYHPGPWFWAALR